MQEQGVSKIVSVKFHKAEEHVLDHTPTSIETPVEGPSIAEEEDREAGREDTLEVAVAE
jgi:hypothetical protein